MTTVLTVHVGEAAHKAGTLAFEASGGRQHSVFTYDQGWTDSPEGFPIAPTMPFANRTFFTTKARGAHGSAFPGPISDTCPDAWGRAILNRDRRNRDEPVSDVDYLAGVDDAARLGALRFRSPDGSFVRPAREGRPIVPPVLELEALMRASDAVEARTETQVDIARLIGNGSSLGGARPKCTVVGESGHLLIAKFTSKADTLPVERMEVATLALARLAGLDAPDARVAMVAGRAVALIKRFDRDAGGRVPYVSAQTMLDYTEATAGSYEELAEGIRRHGAAPAAALAELFSRVAFTILVSNTDDHLRNHGFTHAGNGQWALSPLFDVNPSPERDRRLKTTIMDGGGDEASIEALLKAAPVFRLASKEADAIVSGMAATVARCWRAEAAKAGMTRREADAYEEAFAHREAATALARAQPQPAQRAPGRDRPGRDTGIG